jgi:stage II sporulation protein D (peptidoglycan lytic transglycosylase)
MKRVLQNLFLPALLLLAASKSFGATLRVGVFTLFHPQKVALAPAPGRALIVEGGQYSLVLEDGQTAVCEIAARLIECRAGERDLQSAAIHAAGRGGNAEDFTLSVPDKIVRNFRGKLEIGRARGELVPIVAMDLEAAVASTVAAESPPDAPLEALKAQAIVTRSYYLAASHRHALFDFCDTTHCQFLREAPAPRSPASLAARETEGLVLLYRGAIVPALFSASCGGRTRTLRGVGLSPAPYPFYSVRCAACLRGARRWSARLSLQDAAPILAHPGSEQARLEVDRKLGWEAVPGDNYTLEVMGSTALLTGRGAGHGVGMCQSGAASLAGSGWGFARILACYFPGTSLESRPGEPPRH